MSCIRRGLRVPLSNVWSSLCNNPFRDSALKTAASVDNTNDVNKTLYLVLLGTGNQLLSTYPMSQKLMGATRLLFGNGCV